MSACKDTGYFAQVI